MANSTFQPQCPPPFLSLADYPYKEGFQPGRLCTSIPQLNIDCCLPCPVTYYTYPDNFSSLTVIADWMNVGAFVCCVFLLLSFAVLPVSKTSRHYLTICLIIGIGFMSLAFVIPLGTKPAECYDAITPNDMYSDLSCAFSGALVMGGGFAGVMWVFIRSLSMHLQICWQIVPGRKFFFGALAAGWGIPALSLALSLGFAGVSYRFGNTCHINHHNGLASFWAPLLTFAGLATILQLLTFSYCIRVYVRSLLDAQDETTASSSGLPTINGSIRTVTARAAYRRVKKVILLQWRSLVVVLIVIITVIFFSVVFLKMDNTTSTEYSDSNKALPWLGCLIQNPTNKNACLSYVAPLVMNENIVMAVLFLFSLNGYWCLFFLGRWSMFTAWLDLIRRPFQRSDDHFTSVDARRISDPRNYEMLTTPQKLHMIKGPDGLVATAIGSPMPILPDNASSMKDDSSSFGYGKEVQYRTNTMSYSHPKPPSRAGTTTSTYATERDSQQLHPERAGSIRSTTPLAYAEEWQSMRSQEDAPSVALHPRSASAMSREAAGAALGRSTESRGAAAAGVSPPPHARVGFASTVPRRSPSAAARDWDPRNTYARAAPSSMGERGDAALGRNWSPEPAHLRAHAFNPSDD